MQLPKFFHKLSSAYVRKWWFVVFVSLLFIVFGAVIFVFFSGWVKAFIQSEIVLRNGSHTFDWWRRPPVTPMMSIYVYNVTNADEFLNDGAKPKLQEVGPFVYREKWEKVNLRPHKNGTITFQQRKMYYFDAAASAGSEDDLVIVPNIPMLSATSQSKHAARFLRLAMASIMDILKIKPFVEVSIGQLLWGYEDPLLKLAKDVVPKEQKLPYEEFGLLYGKNGTSKDVVTIFTGRDDVTRYGLINRYNGNSQMKHWNTDECNSLEASDGSLFPPGLTKNSTVYVYEKDLCRRLPLVFQEEIDNAGCRGIKGYRFTPPINVFADIDSNPDNICFCPSGPPCAPNGLFNVSLCQYDSPIMISFPHFYLADPSFREAVEGISPPEKEKHQLYIDIQPEMGAALSARARVQINLAVSQVVDIKQVATFPDIIFPIMWFEEGIDSLPNEVLDLLYLATEVPPLVRVVLSYGLFALGVLLLLISLGCLVRSAGRQETLSLEASNHFAKPKPAANGNRKPMPQLPHSGGKPAQNGTTNHVKSGKDTMDALNPAFVEAPETGVAG
ncbi:scavenger receptor class B member 1-like isoform X2 [Hetaerina americana]|uniref:scavenger receptor class B member 1-like isoform X2 n=1 Tax=Hetaerina americana TaxID=62018 RepID=UPI003A7F34B4